MRVLSQMYSKWWLQCALLWNILHLAAASSSACTAVNRTTTSVAVNYTVPSFPPPYIDILCTPPPLSVFPVGTTLVPCFYLNSFSNLVPGPEVSVVVCDEQWCGCAMCAQVAPVENCTECGQGEYSGAATSYACAPCPAGAFQDFIGATACPLCPVDTYSPVNGSLTCTDCPSGKFANVTGMSSCYDCTPAFCNTTRNETEVIIVLPRAGELQSSSDESLTAMTASTLGVALFLVTFVVLGVVLVK